MKRLFMVLLILCLLFGVVGCRQADRVFRNMSRYADDFQVTRKITVINVRTDTIIFEMIGTMSITNSSHSELAVICKTGAEEYKKHFIYLNDWTTYIVEDISGANVDPYHYELIVYPRMLPIIDVDIK